MSRIGVSQERGICIRSLGTSTLGEVERLAQQHAQEFKVPCNPAWDNTNIIQMRAEEIAKRDHIGNYSRVGLNQWQHDEAIKYVNEGGENTYAVLTDREIAMRFYSIDE
jgi:hypothetical protein